MSGYIGTKSVTLSTTSANVGGDSTVGGDLTVDTNTLYVDSTNNNVGIGTSSPSKSLHILNASSTGSTNPSHLRIEGNNSNYYDIGRDNSGTGYLSFYGSQTSATGYIFGGVDGERMRIDSSGNLQLTSVDQDIEFNATTGAHESRLKWNYGGTLQSWIEREHSDGSMVFGNQGSERMRIDSSGNLLVGTTGSLVAGARVRASSIAATFEGEVTHAGGSGAVFWANRTSSDGWVAAWYRGGSSVGSISVTSSSTSYNTSSDHRLKENVTDVTDGITRVKQLEPKRFNFIADPDKTVDGFLAHEAQTVVPEAITGTHNQVDDDGNPVYQGIDQAKLVPLLTAALKESIAKIEALEARVTALEGN